MDDYKILELLFLPGFAYMLGSVPWGLVLTKIFASEDIRHKGSGNIGATNVVRVAGLTLGVLTLAGDVIKGALPTYIAVTMTGFDHAWGELYISFVSLSAFAGHLYPIFMKFENGGKGVATATGCFLIISPMAIFVSLLVFVMFVCWLDRVSIGSLAAAAALPVTIWEATHSGIMTGYAVVTGMFIFYRHKENITRIIAGTEPRF